MLDENLEILEDMIAALGELVTERDLYKQMHKQELAAKEAMALELESALVKIARLNFYLENS